jgi:hypothetical protein
MTLRREDVSLWLTLEGSGDTGEDCGVLEGRGTYKGALGDLGR